eukprot:9489658-Pyramimonas_sp.AAC.1
MGSDASDSETVSGPSDSRTTAAKEVNSHEEEVEVASKQEEEMPQESDKGAPTGPSEGSNGDHMGTLEKLTKDMSDEELGDLAQVLDDIPEPGLVERDKRGSL